MGNSGSKICPNTELLYKQCMRQYWKESFLASDNPNVCRDEFEDWRLCFQVRHRPATCLKFRVCVF